MNAKTCNRMSVLLLGLAIVVMCVQRTEPVKQALTVTHVAATKNVEPAAMPVINLPAPAIDPSIGLDLKDGKIIAASEHACAACGEKCTCDKCTCDLKAAIPPAPVVTEVALRRRVNSTAACASCGPGQSCGPGMACATQAPQQVPKQVYQSGGGRQWRGVPIVRRLRGCRGC